MPPTEPNVKREILSPGLRFLIWIDCHPRTGWWIAALAVVNTILNVLDLFH